jgi:hypothetical protein
MNVGKLPDFIVVGVQKCGTTALHSNLKKHPSLEITPNFLDFARGDRNTKETDFFTPWSRFTLEEFKSFFNDNGKLQGEISPYYVSVRTLDKIREMAPHAKLILICRDPVSRLESSFNHMLQFQRETTLNDFTGWHQWSVQRSFEENLQGEIESFPQPKMSGPGVVRLGLYADIVERIWDRFDKSQLKILVAEEYRQSPAATYREIAEFLGVPDVPIAHRDAHVREKTWRLLPEQRTLLHELYRPENRRFFELLGREIPAWNASPAVFEGGG